MERRLSPTRRMDWAYFHQLSANLEQRLGHFGAAVQAAERAVALARETGHPSLQLPHFLARLGHSRAAAGDREGGMRALDEAIALAGEADRKSLKQQRELLDIGFDMAVGETSRAARRLAEMLADYRSKGQLVFLRNRPDLAARLANFALEQGIEPDFVHMLITTNPRQQPPSCIRRPLERNSAEVTEHPRTTEDAEKPLAERESRSSRKKVETVLSFKATHIPQAEVDGRRRHQVRATSLRRLSILGQLLYRSSPYL